MNQVLEHRMCNLKAFAVHILLLLLANKIYRDGDGRITAAFRGRFEIATPVNRMKEIRHAAKTVSFFCISLCVLQVPYIPERMEV